MIEKLGFEGSRVFEVEITNAGKTLVITEACDGNFKYEMTKNEVIELSNDFLSISEKMEGDVVSKYQGVVPNCFSEMNSQNANRCVPCSVFEHCKLKSASINEHQPKPSAFDNNISEIEATLQERGNRYGSFDSHAQISQELKAVCSQHDKGNLSNSQREALSMICHKIGRILNGDPNYADSWHDIAGYATLVEKEINAKA